MNNLRITVWVFTLLILTTAIFAKPVIKHDFTVDDYCLDVLYLDNNIQLSLQDQALSIEFESEVSFDVPFGSFFSGYEAIKVHAEIPAEGTMSLILFDINKNEYTASKEVNAGEHQIHFDSDSFSSTQEGCPPTIEYIQFQYSPHTGTDKTLRLFSLGYADPQPFQGPWIAIDPVFSFYQGMDWNDFARQVKNKGFVGIQLISIWADPTIAVQQSIVESFHNQDLICILRMYPSTDLAAYQQNPEWRQKMLDGSSSHDWRVYLCPNSDDFTQHQVNRVHSIMNNVPYDAIELAENWFEVWGGPYPDNPNHGKYACICDNCRNKFIDRADTDPVHLFDEESSYYFLLQENESLYEQWVQFRIDSIISFADTLFGAAQDARPDVKLVHMHLSDCTVDPGKSAEYQAQDLVSAVEELQPDVVIIQDAWQDWIRPGLSPDFVVTYGDYYVDKVLDIKPDVKMIVHADIGSLDQMRRSFSWMREMNTYARQAGFHGVDFYEYSVGDFSLPAPQILHPTPGESKVLPLNLQGSVFEQLGWTGEHLQTKWEIALDEEFTSLLWSKIDESDPLHEYSAIFSVTGPDAPHYLRTRYRNSFRQWSSWSETAAFYIDYTGVKNWHLMH